MNWVKWIFRSRLRTRALSHEHSNKGHSCSPHDTRPQTFEDLPEAERHSLYLFSGGQSFFSGDLLFCKQGAQQLCCKFPRATKSPTEREATNEEVSYTCAYVQSLQEVNKMMEATTFTFKKIITRNVISTKRDNISSKVFQPINVWYNIQIVEILDDIKRFWSIILYHRLQNHQQEKKL